VTSLPPPPPHPPTLSLGARAVTAKALQRIAAEGGHKDAPELQVRGISALPRPARSQSSPQPALPPSPFAPSGRIAYALPPSPLRVQSGCARHMESGRQRCLATPYSPLATPVHLSLPAPVQPPKPDDPNPKGIEIAPLSLIAVVPTGGAFQGTRQRDFLPLSLCPSSPISISLISITRLGRLGRRAGPSTGARPSTRCGGSPTTAAAAAASPTTAGSAAARRPRLRRRPAWSGPGPTRRRRRRRTARRRGRGQTGRRWCAASSPTSAHANTNSPPPHINVLL
jgi:hypothetical protein